jgi:hypothetical protein
VSDDEKIFLTLTLGTISYKRKVNTSTGDMKRDYFTPFSTGAYTIKLVMAINVSEPQ